MNAQAPIFVRGMSRSGGTLVVTMLDAHPDVAMSYELYPTLLELESSNSSEELSKILRGMRTARTQRAALAGVSHRGLKTFIARMPRSGLDFSDFAELMTAHLDEGDTLDDPGGRLRFIGRCAHRKMTAVGKSRWGMKCNNKYEDYLAVWPSACFLNVVRDGRDVLASQLHTGSFKNGPREVANSWVQTHRKFRTLLDQPGVRAFEIRYERLVADPAAEMTAALAAVGLRNDAAVLQHHEKALTVFKSGHLSIESLVKPVNASSVGRWRKDLTPDQVNEFISVAGDMMIELGYEVG